MEVKIKTTDQQSYRSMKYSDIYKRLQFSIIISYSRCSHFFISRLHFCNENLIMPHQNLLNKKYI